MFFPYLKLIKSLIGILNKSPSIGEIEIKEIGRRIYIRCNSKTPSVYQLKGEKEADPGQVAIVEPENIAKSPKNKILILSDVVVPINNYVVTKLPRNKRFQIWMPLFLKMSLAGTAQWVELTTLRSPARGIFNYTPGPIKPDGASQNRWFLDPITDGELIGTITISAAKAIPVYSRESGYIISFQVLDGVEIQKRDIVLIYAKRLSGYAVIPQIFDAGERFSLPRDSKIQIWIPHYVPVSMGRNVEIYDLKPIFANSQGYLRYPPLEYGARETNEIRKTHQFFDFLVTDEEIASTYSDDKSVTGTIKSPGPGYLVGFQVLNNTEVEPGDITMLIAQKRSQ